MELDIIRTHIKEMLENRGDDVSYIEEHGDVVDVQRYYNEMIILNTDITTVIFALTKDTLKEWKSMEEDAEMMISKYKTKYFILILNEQPSSAVLSYITMRDKTLQSLGGLFQVFYMKELMYNPLKHTLVPKHKKITEAEAKKVMEKYLAKKSQFPIIYKTDVVARWLGLRHGDTVEITRYNDTSGLYYYYRTCV